MKHEFQHNAIQKKINSGNHGQETEKSQFGSLHMYILADFSAQGQETAEQPSLPCDKPKAMEVNLTYKLT